MQRLEQENNRLFIEAYGLQDELTPDVPLEQITLTRADREKDSQRLISYAIGCMMGRYCLDKAGLMYAHAGNVDFDEVVRQAHHERNQVHQERIQVHHERIETQGERFVGADLSAEGRMNSPLQSFVADEDGIIPVTDEFWFENDATKRLHEFLAVVWGEQTQAENSAWLADSLGRKANEFPEETLRRYLANNFFKDHLQTYKKRPIYWLFSSGKHGAFQALVYLHRYNDSTLAKLRNHYVVPLMGRLLNRLEMLEQDRDAATSPASKNKIGKEIERFNKKKLELSAFDEKLRH